MNSIKIQVPTKAETKNLAPFSGLRLDQIIIPISKEDFISVTNEIKLAKIVGFDTESKPIFKKGLKSEGPHVVQFALKDKAFIFQLHQKDCQHALLEIFQSEDIRKVGFGLKSDQAHIYKKLGIQINAVLDLNILFRQKGYRGEIGARGAIAVVFNKQFYKSKRMSTSNWALSKLSDNQLIYAANDAYAALCVFNELELNI